MRAAAIRRIDPLDVDRNLMDLVSIPANPVPEDAVTGMLKTRDGVSIRYARWHPPPGRKGTVACSRAAPNSSRNISRPCASCARAALRSPPSTGAGRAAPSARSRDPRKGHVGDFSEYELDARSADERGRAAGLPAADLRARPFDGRHGADAHRPPGQPLVRPHRAVGADDPARRQARHARRPRSRSARCG